MIALTRKISLVSGLLPEIEIAEAERTLMELSRINDEEERNLRAWKDEIEKI